MSLLLLELEVCLSDKKKKNAVASRITDESIRFTGTSMYLSCLDNAVLWRMCVYRRGGFDWLEMKRVHFFGVTLPGSKQLGLLAISLCPKLALKPYMA